MDKIDRKILYAISEDARESRNKIAKKAGISREVLDYRIKNLEKQGIITGYQARINLSLFAYGSYILLIQASGQIRTIEKEILEKIKNHPRTHYIEKIGGNYDFLINFTVKNLEELKKYINILSNSFGKHKSKMIILTMIEEAKESVRSIFSEKNELNQIMSVESRDKRPKLDEIDKKVLIQLSKDGRTYSPIIAKQIEMTEVAARKRIQNLVKDRIILNFRTMIDFTKVELQPTNILLKINPSSQAAEKKMKFNFQEDRKIIYAARLVGEFDYIITILNKDNKELNEYISELREQFSEIITEINICPSFELLHHNYITEEFFE